MQQKKKNFSRTLALCFENILNTDLKKCKQIAHRCGSEFKLL